MGIETYGSMVKQIVNDVHDADVSVVTLFRTTARPHGYMVIDMKQNTPDILRLRTFIFPVEEQKAYVES
jgi:hypothetical protein